MLLVVLAASLAGFSGCGGSTSGANANIAFMGDSITYYWSLPRTNLGVGGNTTTQMLARYPSEIPGHNYKMFILLGGTNDVRDPYTTLDKEVATAIANITKMAALAQQEKLIVVLCALPPIQTAAEAGRAEALNAQILKLAQTQGYLYVDYYTPMANHPEYFKDILHPNDAGYAVMKTALEKVVTLTY